MSFNVGICLQLRKDHDRITEDWGGSRKARIWGGESNCPRDLTVSFGALWKSSCVFQEVPVMNNSNLLGQESP